MPTSLSNRKFLEIRDEGICIAVMAMRLVPENPIQAAFMRHAGYGDNPSSYVVMLDLHSWEGGYDPFKQMRGERRTAHLYIREHFDELSDGDVIDVEFINGDSKTKKTSEILAYYMAER